MSPIGTHYEYLLESCSQTASCIRLHTQQHSSPRGVWSSQYKYFCRMGATIYNVVGVYQYFEEYYCLHLHGRLSSCCLFRCESVDS
jgi:hypothetical protein